MSWETELFDFHSYPYQNDAVALQLKAVTLEGPDGRTQTMDDVENSASLDIHERVDDIDEWETVKIELEYCRSSNKLDPAWLQIICEDTRFEQVEPVTQKEGDTSPHVLHLDIDKLRNTVVLRPLTTSANDQEPGLVTGEGDRIEIHLDRKPDPFGSGLRTEWSALWFSGQGRKNAMSWLDFPSDGDPILYLNSGIEGFQDMLNSKGPHGPLARTRQFMLDLITAQTWMALGRRAASQVYEVDSEREELREIDEELLTQWQGAALNKIASFMGSAKDDDPQKAAAGALLDHSRQEEVRASVEAALPPGKGISSRLEKLADALGEGE
jgi:hypothetical protein